MNDSAERLKSIASAPVKVIAFGPARDLIQGVGTRSFLHAGPPLAASQTVGAMRGAMIGSLILEGEAENVEDAERIIVNDDLEMHSCHDAGGVGALAGVISPGSPVILVEREGGQRAFASVVEGLGRALSFGNHDQPTLTHLRWLAGPFSDILNEAFALIDPIDIVDLQAKALRRGDEGHNRVVAGTEMLVTRLAPAFLSLGSKGRPALEELIGNPHFFLTLSIAAAKSVALTIESRGPRGIVTALSGNGLNTGFKVSGAPDVWYLGEAAIPEDMMVIPGRTAADAAPLMGDSAITETVGLGAFSMTAALSLARVLGVDARGAQDIVDKMRQICVTEHPRYLLPAEDFRGSPFGVSVSLVHEHGITPAANAGYAHKEPGEGRVGANVAWFPLEPFARAATVFNSTDPVEPVTRHQTPSTLNL